MASLHTASQKPFLLHSNRLRNDWYQNLSKLGCKMAFGFACNMKKKIKGYWNELTHGAVSVGNARSTQRGIATGRRYLWSSLPFSCRSLAQTFGSICRSGCCWWACWDERDGRLQEATLVLLLLDDDDVDADDEELALLQYMLLGDDITSRNQRFLSDFYRIISQHSDKRNEETNTPKASLLYVYTGRPVTANCGGGGQGSCSSWARLWLTRSLLENWKREENLLLEKPWGPRRPSHSFSINLSPPLNSFGSLKWLFQQHNFRP